LKRNCSTRFRKPRDRCAKSRRSDCSTTSGDATISELTSSSLLSARGLALRRGQDWLFRDLDLSIGPGQLLWLRGPNGSGKTSLLRLLVGLSEPDDGEILRSGTTHKHGPGAADVVYIGHIAALKDGLSAWEALQFMACLHGRDGSPGRITAALQRLGVGHRARRSVRTLSQGQRRRVALARLALEQTAALWVLDEPFDALDAQGIDTVVQLIREHLARQGAVVLTSHLPFDLPGVAVQTLDLDKRARHAR